ncbi:MAG: DUF975 family protein [Oscillospiraceae bacterium]|jgi:uncharacterized membrane protein|nr:DUF975 family protein [Oscillospiraceae bacterium]
MINRAELKAAAKAQIQGNIGILFVCTLVLGVIIGVLSLIPIIGTVAGTILIAPLTIGLIRIYFGLRRGEKPVINSLFSALDILVNAVLLNIFIEVFTFLWSLLLFVPGIIKGISYSFAPYILAEHPELSAMEALNASKELTQGHKMDIFVLGLSFILWGLLVSVTFGLAIIYVGPYVQATMTNCYYKLKELKGYGV